MFKGDSFDVRLGCVMSRAGWLALLATTALTGAAAAQESGPAVALDEITVTAARAPRPIDEIPQSVQVIERREIEEQLTSSPSPAAALSRLVPGYSVPNSTVSSASETFRGRNLLVLLDGVPLNTPLRDVSRIVNLIDLNAVERIEVVAGASSLYSAGATGGTVNFITRRPAGGAPRFTVNTALRAFTENVGRSLAPDVSVGATGKVPGGVDYALTGTGRFARRTYDGEGRELPSDALLGQGGGDRFALGAFTGRLGYDFDATKRLEFGFSQFLLDQDPHYLTNYTEPFARPDFTRPYPGKSVSEDTSYLFLRYTDRDTFLGAVSLLGFHNNIEKRFNYSEFSYPANSLVTYSFNPLQPTSLANQTTLFSSRSGLNATVDTLLDALLPGLKLTWGGDLIREDTRQRAVDGADVFTPLEQTTYAGFALLQLPVGERLTLRGGMRYEYFDLSVSDFVRPSTFAAQAARTPLGFATFVLPAVPVTGGDFSYEAPTFNVGGTFKLTTDTELFAGFSQGFALPDVGAFTRRAGLSVAFACPVARPFCLRPGTSIAYSTIAPEAQIVDSYDVGIRGRSGIFSGSLAGFVSTSDGGVTFDPLTNRISQQKEIIAGVEFAGDAQITENFALSTVLTYREGRYDSDGDGSIDSFLPNNRIASPFRAVISGTYRFDNGVTFRLEGEGFSERDVRIDLAGTRFPLKDAFLVNAALTAPLAGGQAYVAVNNLFDTAYENPTATAVRNLDVCGFGRTVTLGYRRTF
jgi:iron complex outermembrane recepter protein